MKLELFLVCCTIASFALNLANTETCVWTVNGFTLDLSGLLTITFSYVDGSYTYAYTPCRNDLKCDATDRETGNLTETTYMATQTGNKCNYLASWNASVNPVEQPDSYTMTYRNGEKSGDTRYVNFLKYYKL